MSASSTSRSALIVRVEVPYCFCAQAAKLRESWKPDNPGRRFYNCAKSLVEPNYCEFFRWVDPPLTQHYKDLLRGLKQRSDEMANQYEVEKLQKKLEKQKELRIVDKEEAAARIHELKLQLDKMKNLLVAAFAVVGIIVVYLKMV